jgi:type IV pilus assembly protein PilA
MTTRNSESTNAGCGCLLLLMLLGAVSAMVLPSVLYPPHKCSHTSEAMQYVGSMNRAQKAIFDEEGAFATSVDALGMGIKTETTHFKYSVHVTKQAAFHYGVSKNEKLKSYVGGVFLIPVEGNAAKNEIRTDAILCRADNPGTFSPLRPILQSGKLVCGYGTSKVTK